MNLFFFISKSLFASKCTFLGQKIRKNEGRFYSLSETKGKGTALSVCALTPARRLFDFFLSLKVVKTHISFSLSLCACVCVSSKSRRPQQIAAAGAAAIVLFNSAPANAEVMGLTLQNGVPNAAAQKFVQPFVPDGRPVVYVEKDGAADITTFDGRLAANVARSNVGCKTITGAPCVDFASGASK